jgi:tetratricopeptide (TPR) repeat protein
LLGQLEVKAYRDFLIEVLQATEESGADSQVVYPLLEANLDKLDDKFAQALRSWATAILPKLEPEQAQDLAVIIGNFSNLIQEFRLDKRTSNLEIGIAGYEIVATVFTRQAFPQEWGTTQNNLGHVYLYRIRGERAENLEAAIRYFSAALEEYTRQGFLKQWATTQNNLGLAYLYRIWGERAENLEAAICCFSAALQVRTSEAFPQEWAATQNNLSVTYCQRIQGERAENLETAIHCYEAALEVSTRKVFPHGWATIQNNLGNAYLERIQGEKVENLEAAIRCFSAALQVFTREAFPYDWATIQNNLGIAYRNRIRGERAKNLEAAIRCFLAALQVRTREAFPQNYAETQFNLGLAYQDVRQLPNAYSAFATAIDTLESLRDKIVSGDKAKQKLAEEWNPLYQGMVEVSLELHGYAQAIKYVERSEAGNLVELLARPDFYPEGNIPAGIPNELNRLRQEITSQLQPIDMEVERRRRGILTWKTAEAERNEERFLVAS